MTIHPLFTVHMLRPFHAFSNILEADHQNVQCFIWIKKIVFHFTAVRYSFYECSKTMLLLKRQFTVHVSPVFWALLSTEARKTCYRVVIRSQSGQFHTLESFATKIVSSRLSRHWSSEASFVTLLGPINQMQLKGCQSDQLIKSSDGV